ncbi:unnamed protein product [Medioppia subpectinata]|uniref:Uncharacterized protein n=1 Tax=Medioppia subpectinata TaxID=1979941 RepID=A0A7R9Q1J1_9ACAR|nr:unnamed protein product [Medioppia subpectinata]CAG2109156.1 unnamed protein product [Medioppia subpectinata]
MSALKASNESELRSDLTINNKLIVSFDSEMSALKASNESEVKALKAQLKTSDDSIQTMDTEIKDLRQQLMTSKNSALTQEIKDLKAKNETEVQALKVQLKKTLDLMETQINGLKQINQNTDIDLKKQSCENSLLRVQLSSMKASKQIIESGVKLLAQEIDAQNISSLSVEQDLSSGSAIGSGNQLTTNSDKTRDEINIQDMFQKLENQNKMTNNLLKDLISKKEKTGLEFINELFSNNDSD